MTTLQMLLEVPHVWMMGIALIILTSILIKMTWHARTGKPAVTGPALIGLMGGTVLMGVVLNQAHTEAKKIQTAVTWFQAEEFMNITQNSGYLRIIRPKKTVEETLGGRKVQVTQPPKVLEINRRLLEKALRRTGGDGLAMNIPPE